MWQPQSFQYWTVNEGVKSSGKVLYRIGILMFTTVLLMVEWWWPTRRQSALTTFEPLACQ